MKKPNDSNIPTSTWSSLSDKARDAYHKAYAPYSQFKVGAAALTTENTIVQGCNVENASYGLTICAERNCIAQGIIASKHQGKVEFKALVIYTEQEKLTPPCGACRQVISEFFPQSGKVMATNHINDQQVWTVAQLLPDAFLSADLLDKG